MSARALTPQLLIDHLHAIALPKDRVEAFYLDLIRHLQNRQNLKVIRKAGRRFRGRTPDRGTLLSVPAGRVVCGDNEAAVWVWTQLMREWKAGASIEQLLMNRIMPVADSRSEDGSTFKLETVKRPWAGLYDHKHIYDAGRNFEPDLERISESDLAAMCMRLLNPMNHFLYPSDFQSLAEHDAPPQRVAAWFALQRYGSLFEEFCSIAKADIAFARSGESLASSELLPQRELSSPPAVLGPDLVRRLKNHSRPGKVSNTTGNDESNFENSKAIDPSRTNAPYYLDLHWLLSDGAKLYLGLFQLDLRKLLDAGVIYKEPRSGDLRLKIQHCRRDGGFYVRRTIDGPSIRLDTFPEPVED